MALDLAVARELCRETGGDRYRLEKKLEARFDDLGPVLWALHREGTLDCSADDGWWSEMAGAAGAFDAGDVAKLLLAASRHDDLGGLRSTWRSHQDGWNIWARKLVDAVIATPGPLVDAWPALPEPMHSALGLELLARGALPAEATAGLALDRLAREGVQEVGGQPLARLILQVWPAEVAGPALCRAAAEPGVCLWDLEFLEGAGPFATPRDLAGIALNVDYASTVTAAWEVLDARSDGVEAAIEDLLREGFRPQDLGLPTALGWLARRAAARGATVSSAVARRLVDARLQEAPDPVVVAILPGLPDSSRETLLKAGIREHRLGWLQGGCTSAAAAAALTLVTGWKRRVRVPSGTDEGLAAVARAFPGDLVAATRQRCPHRLVLVRAMGAATDPVVLPALVQSLGDSVEEVRDAAVDALVAYGAGALGAVTEASTSKKKDVRAGAEKVLARLRPSATLAPEERIEAARAGLPDERREAFDQVWRDVRWEDLDPREGAERLCADHSDGLLVAYDGLFRSHGETRKKLSLWREVLLRSPKDAAVGELAIRMVAGWPLGEEGWDDAVQDHDAAIRAYYAFVADWFGPHAEPGVAQVLREGDASGHDALLAFGLAQGFAAVRAMIPDLAPSATAGALAEAIRALGAEALPAVVARLGAKKLDDRITAAEALLAAPIPDAAPALAAAHAAEKSDRARAAVARAAFAVHALGRTGPPDDTALAAFPGPVPKDATVRAPLSWKDGTPVSEGARTWILSRLADLSPTADDADLRGLRERLDPDAASALWQALRRRFDGELAARTGWVLLAGAVLASEADVDPLGADLDELARGGASAEAFARVELFARHGSPAALRWLDHHARTARSQGLRARATDALDRAAEAAGVSRDEIADAAVPNLGFAPDGTRTLPDGIVLWLAADGSIAPPTATVPEPGLRKQAKALAKAAAARLEIAMVTGRTWSKPALAAWCAGPILGAIGRQLAWATDAGLARLLPSGELVALDGSAIPWTRARVAHALELSDAERRAWAGAGLSPPFAQLARRTLRSVPEEAGVARVERFEGAEFELRKLRRVLEDRGWTRGVPGDGGGVTWYARAFPRAGVTAVVRLDPGFAIGHAEFDEAQHVPAVEFADGLWARDLPYRPRLVPPSAVDPVVYSETLGDVVAAQP